MTLPFKAKHNYIYMEIYKTKDTAELQHVFEETYITCWSPTRLLSNKY